MSNIKSYRDLLIWQKAMDLTVKIYEITKQFPKDELYGLTSQIRRAAVSIPSNIAEGQARQTRKEFKQFLHIAKGSLAELDTQVCLANRVNYIDEKTRFEITNHIIEIQKMTASLIKKL